jgi:hypothetical protein
VGAVSNREEEGSRSNLQSPRGWAQLGLADANEDRAVAEISSSPKGGPGIAVHSSRTDKFR